MILNSVVVAALVAGVSLSAHAFEVGEGQGVDGCDQCAHAWSEQELERIAGLLLPMMPEAQRQAIVAQDGIGSAGYSADAREGSWDIQNEFETASLWVEHKLGTVDTGSLTARQLEVIRTMAAAIDNGIELPPICMSPDSDRTYALIINELLYGVNPNAFQQFDRWQRTAISGTGLEQGDPTVITYSYVADGTFIANVGFGSGNSQLFAWLNSLYGSTAAWQDLFTQVFDRWEELTGTSYVYEPNDDGSSMFSGFGTVGVRGDVRIGAMVLDGNSGVLAFNFFPEDGDMVFDAFDSFYNITSNNSLRFRNVAAHEHGHGLGMAHVCPANETKLMEPFVSTAYDGPQLDDILNGQRHYGDPFEPSDSAGTAVDLGLMQLDDQASMTGMSLDNYDDRDFFKITLATPLLVTFTATPDADTYEQGPQTKTCSSGTQTNYNVTQDLIIHVYDSDDLINPIQTSLIGFPGSPEIMVFHAPEGREYWFEVASNTTAAAIQRYRIDVDTDTLLVIGGAAPSFLEPGVENTITVTINPFEQNIEPGTELLYYRSEAGLFTSVPLVVGKGLEYFGTLPSFDCDPTTEIEYYFAASMIGSNLIFTYPLGGSSDPFVALIGEPVPFFMDNFQSDLGWTIEGSVVGQLSGEWERGVPAGDGSRGEPTVDADGSGSCYLTGNGGPGTNTDVDGGDTVLVSPVFDISLIDRPSVSYWRWFDNTGGGVGSGPDEDVFTVYVTDDEVTWIAIDIVGPDSIESKGGWIFVEIDLLNALSGFPLFDFATTQLRFKFVAEDLTNPSVIEAAVDGVNVNELSCDDPQPVITLAVEPASEVLPGVEYVFDVLIDEPIDTVVPGSEMLMYQLASGMPGNLGGGYIQVPLVSNGGNSYTATIPAQDCNPDHDMLPVGSFDVSYFIQVEGVITGITTFPELGDQDPLGINIGDPVLISHDNFELDTGWLVSGGAKSPADGMWERGVPLGDGTRGDPTADGDGSGSCYVTGNTVGGANSDVDGQTILTSPVFDASGLIAPTIEFYRWYDNTGAGIGPAPGNDVMEIGISYDGGAFYETLGTVGPNNADSIGGWILAELPLDVFGPATSTMRVRFIVTDQGLGSVIEAGIDGVTFSGLVCENVVSCPADLFEDGELDFFDVSAFLAAFGSGDPIADFFEDGELDFFDVSAFLAAFAAGCP